MKLVNCSAGQWKEETANSYIWEILATMLALAIWRRRDRARDYYINKQEALQEHKPPSRQLVLWAVFALKEIVFYFVYIHYKNKMCGSRRWITSVDLSITWAYYIIWYYTIFLTSSLSLSLDNTFVRDITHLRSTNWHDIWMQTIWQKKPQIAVSFPNCCQYKQKQKHFTHNLKIKKNNFVKVWPFDRKKEVRGPK